jgi:hypothetical protein
MLEGGLHKLDALGSGAAHMIHPGDGIIGAKEGAADRLDATLGLVVDGDFVDPVGDGVGEGQIGSGTLRAFRLS